MLEENSVRTYQLYLIVMSLPPISSEENKLFFHLFKEYEETSGEIKNILEKQIRFITKPIQSLKIDQYIRQSLQSNKCFYTNKGTYYIDISKRSFAQLEIKEHCLVLNASGNYEAETIFFEVLRKLSLLF